mgnify:CR=1 FL=1
MATCLDLGPRTLNYTARRMRHLGIHPVGTSTQFRTLIRIRDQFRIRDQSSAARRQSISPALFPDAPDSLLLPLRLPGLHKLAPLRLHVGHEEPKRCAHSASASLVFASHGRDAPGGQMAQMA